MCIQTVNMDDTDRFNSIEKHLTTFKSQINSLHNQIKLLDKKVKQEYEEPRDIINKNKKLNYFTKPSKISIQLTKFMNKSEEENVARTEATEFIINYIKKHKLDISTTIQPDTKLKKLFDLLPEEEITYFNIHNYIDKHFIK